LDDELYHANEFFPKKNENLKKFGVSEKIKVKIDLNN
jgi:hypothetical protein